MGGLIVATILVFTWIRLYEKGYRFGLPTIVVAPGILEIQHYDPLMQIYLDASEKPLMGIPPATQTLRLPISSGSHQISVAQEGYFPWQKTVDVGARETITVAPFAVPSSTSGIVLPKTDQEYKSALAAIATTTVPTEARPLVSNDGTMSVYLKDGALTAKVVGEAQPPKYFCETECRDEHAVLSLDADVRGVAFLPGRNDVVFVAVGNSIYALELDTRGTQNFEPVYQGIRPTFGVGPGYLYVQDGESVFIVSLTPHK